MLKPHIEYLKEHKSSLKIQHVNIPVNSIRYAKVDFDVFLESKSTNLQRKSVWNLLQKRELINSILIGRKIPELSAINLYDNSYQIIDGKQRLLAILDFLNDKFDILLDGNFYSFDKLPEDYKNRISRFFLDFNIVYEMEKISDEEKIKWFILINFSGTNQEKEHLVKLESLLFVGTDSSS